MDDKDGESMVRTKSYLEEMIKPLPMNFDVRYFNRSALKFFEFASRDE